MNNKYNECKVDELIKLLSDMISAGTIDANDKVRYVINTNNKPSSGKTIEKKKKSIFQGDIHKVKPLVVSVPTAQAKPQSTGYKRRSLPGK